MRSYFKIPLVFLVVGAILGVLLRWHFVSPMEGFHFMNWLHGHSHIMFLGWVTNALFLAFVFYWCHNAWSTRFRLVFWILQLLVVGMFISFPLQGYGAFSIALLTAHNIVSYVFCFRVWRLTKDQRSQSVAFVRNALLLFVISTIGAFAVAPIAANGLGQSKWYYFAIFFYLHFQYNGFFLFGVFAILFEEFDKRGIAFPMDKVRIFRRTLFFACFPAYFLSLLWSETDIVTQSVSVLAGSAQVVALVFLFQILHAHRAQLVKSYSIGQKAMLLTFFLSFVMKTLLQLLSAVPLMHDMAFGIRFFILAYLHLVLIGCISMGLIFWLSTQRLCATRSPAVFAFLLAFAGSEMAMVLVPLFGSLFQMFSAALLVFSLLMAIFFATLLQNDHHDLY